MLRTRTQSNPNVPECNWLPSNPKTPPEWNSANMSDPQLGKKELIARKAHNSREAMLSVCRTSASSFQIKGLVCAWCSGGKHFHWGLGRVLGVGLVEEGCCTFKSNFGGIWARRGLPTSLVAGPTPMPLIISRPVPYDEFLDFLGHSTSDSPKLKSQITHHTQSLTSKA